MNLLENFVEKINSFIILLFIDYYYYNLYQKIFIILFEVTNRAFNTSTVRMESTKMKDQSMNNDFI